MGILSNESAESNQQTVAQSGQLVFAPGSIVLRAGRGGGGRGGSGGSAPGIQAGGSGGEGGGGGFSGRDSGSSGGKGNVGTGGIGGIGAPGIGAPGGNAIYETQFPVLESINVGYNATEVESLLARAQSYVGQGQEFATGAFERAYTSEGEQDPPISKAALGIVALAAVGWFLLRGSV